MISEIKSETGFSYYQIERVLDALEESINERFVESEDNIEIKLFPGVSLIMDDMPARCSNLYNSGSISDGNIIQFGVKYTDKFRRKIRKNRLLQKEGEVNSSNQ